MKDKIENILVKYDPMGLIRMGAPLDEYNLEARLIFENIDKIYSVEKIQQLVYDIFRQSFGTGTMYRMIDGVFTKVGEKTMPDEKVDRIVGDFNFYRLMAEDIKKILSAT